jgi:putative acetyltransferase
VIRYARPADHAAISAVVTAAFRGAGEARLIEQLRADGDAMFELVAEEAGDLVGHVLFSRLWADRDDLFAALAPLAVRPDRQRRGVGGQLVRAALEAAPQFGAVGVLVLGDPAYYGRFGFSSEAAARVACPYSGLAGLQALALQPGVFDAALTVAYPYAFADEERES